MDFIIKCFYLLFLIIFFLANFEVLAAIVKEPLKFIENEFKILQLTDLHYGEGGISDEKNSALIEKLIVSVNPDLVVLTGDIISGYSWDGITKDFTKNLWTKLTDIFTKTQTKYAFTFGNHDDQADLNREQIFELDKKNPFSYTKRSYDMHGLTNYVLPVYSSKLDSISANLWFFDSNDSGCKNEIISWGCIEDDQIISYRLKSKLLQHQIEQNGIGSDFGIAFMHIPIPEFIDLYNTRPTYGDRYEGINCPKVNSGLYKEIKRSDNIQAIFVGHDHNNDFGGFLRGIELIYGRKTGYGGYGPDYFLKGARIITLKEEITNNKINVKMTHKIIQEDGIIIDQTQNTSWRGYYFVWECTFN